MFEEYRDKSIKLIPKYMPDYTDFLREAQQIINDGRKDKDLTKKTLDLTAWQDLENIVEDYLYGYDSIKHFISRTQYLALERVINSSRNLLTNLNKAKEIGAYWYLQHELKSEELEALTHCVEKIKNIEVRTPLIDSTKKKINQDELLKKSIRGELQVNLDKWWLDNTSLPINEIDFEESIYSDFLSTLFSFMTHRNAPGSSKRAIHKARRENEKWRKKYEDEQNQIHQSLKLLAKELSKLAKT